MDSPAPSERAPGTPPPAPPMGPGQRVILVGYLAVLLTFIAWTSAVVVPQIFANDPKVGPHVSEPCARELRALAQALDRGLRASLWARDEEDAATRFRHAVDPDWDRGNEAARACGGPGEADALSAVIRQRRIQEGWARRHARETGPLGPWLESPPAGGVSR